MNTFSFAKVVRDLIEFCTSHARIAQVYYEKEYQMEGSTEANYPAIIIEREASQMIAGENVFSLRISVIDMPKENESDLIDIDSKTFSILSDIRARFTLGETAQYSVSEIVTNEPITHEKNDRVRGFAAVLDFSVRADADGCEYPTNE